METGILCAHCGRKAPQNRFCPCCGRLNITIEALDELYRLKRVIEIGPRGQVYLWKSRAPIKRYLFLTLATAAVVALYPGVLENFGLFLPGSFEDTWTKVLYTTSSASLLYMGAAVALYRPRIKIKKNSVIARQGPLKIPFLKNLRLDADQVLRFDLALRKDPQTQSQFCELYVVDICKKRERLFLFEDTEAAVFYYRLLRKALGQREHIEKC